MNALTEGLNAFIEWLLLASFKSLPLIFILLLAQIVLKKYLSASARHSLWLTIFICLSVPFGWDLSWSPITKDADEISQTNIITPTALRTAIPINVPAQAIKGHQNDVEITHSKKADENFNFFSWLGYSWLSAFLCLCVITLWQVTRFNRIKKSAIIATPQQEKLLQSCKNQIGMNKNIPLFYSKKIDGPLTLGLCKPVIILPENIDLKLSQAQLSHVLLHELSHIKRHDILWNWLAYWIVLLHWFNPAVWYAFKRMKADMEMACDAKVLAHLCRQEHNDYGLTFINVSQTTSRSQGITHSLGILENHSELKDRLIMIKEFTTMTLKKSLIFGTLLGFLTLTALAQPSQKTKEVSGHISADASITLQQFAEKAEQDLKTKILIGINSDSRVQANVSQSPITYEQLLTQLQINGFTAFKTKDYIQIVSVRDARTLAPIAEEGKTYFADEFVTDYIKLEKACSESVLAAVRPLVPSYGFLSTYVDAKTLIIVDAFSNIQRVKSVVATIENNLAEPSDCVARNQPAEHRSASKK